MTAVSATVALAGLTGAALVGPLLVRWLTRVAAPGGAAAVAVLALVNLALLPLVWLACLGSGLPVPGMGVAAACLPALGSTTGHRAELALAFALFAILVARVVTAIRASSAAGPHGMALAACQPRPLPGGGFALVLPTAEPVAFVAGFHRPRVVVSTGLLDALPPTEQHAVLAHEAAHVRLGHARLLTVGSALARTYQWMPGINRTWVMLRRAVEAAADEAAAAAAGTPPLLRALARVALLHGDVRAPAFGDSDEATLRYRIDRLRSARPSSGRWPATAAAVGLVASVSWSGCILGARVDLAGLAGCALVAVLLALRAAGGAHLIGHRWPASSACRR